MSDVSQLLIGQVGQLGQLAISASWLRVYLVVIFSLILLSWLVRLVLPFFGVTAQSSLNPQPKPILFIRFFWPLQLIWLFIFLLISLAIIVPAPSIVSPQLPLFEPLEVTDQKPLIVSFDRPIRKELVGKISPWITGKWLYKSGDYSPFLINQIIFTPQHSLLADKEYLVRLNNVGSILPIANHSTGLLFVFKTPPFPQVTSVKPPDKEINVANDIALEVSFSSGSNRGVEWSFILEPAIETVVSFDPARLRAFVKPRLPLLSATTYTFNIFRRPVVFSYHNQKVVEKLPEEKIFQSNFTTAESAQIVSIKPMGQAILPFDPLEIIFKQPMEESSVNQALKIDPPLMGETKWLNTQHFIFTPLPAWVLATSYTVTLSSRAKNIYGGSFPKDYTHQFSTVGEVKVVQTKPPDQAMDVPIGTSIIVTFDQPIDQGQAEGRFFIKPAIAGSFSLNANTLNFAPQGKLDYDRQYSLGIEAGIKSLYGLDSTQTYQWTFTTEPEKFVLDIPLYKQHYMFTCFSAAAQMVLAFRGIANIDEIGFMDEIGYDQTPRNFVTNTWGNPNKGVVGSYDGSGTGGYGAHWDPLAEALGKYRLVEVKRYWNIRELLMNVKEGNPVIVWWVNGVWPAKDVSWNLPNGEKVYTVNGMHAEVVKGWVGSIDDPKYIFTNDPWRGHRQYTPEQFAFLWQWFANTAVVVY